jgi:hypothetical protein
MLFSFPCFTCSFCESHILKHTGSQRWVFVRAIRRYFSMLYRCVDADQDLIRIGINMMPILMQILPQVSIMLENPNLYKKICNSVVSLQCFIFLISYKDVIILSVLVSILKFLEKVWFINLSYAWH